MAITTYLTEDLGNGEFRTESFNAPVPEVIRVYSDSTRPAASTYPVGRGFWNTSDNAMNWSDGTNWRNNAGSTT